jgi:hypothetical protein
MKQLLTLLLFVLGTSAFANTDKNTEPKPATEAHETAACKKQLPNLQRFRKRLLPNRPLRHKKRITTPAPAKPAPRQKNLLSGLQVILLTLYTAAMLSWLTCLLTKRNSDV